MRERDPNVLESWKEIAAFIGRDLRTAMRWAKEKGMPVRRVPGGKRGRVFAYAEEIREWLHQDGTGGGIKTGDCEAADSETVDGKKKEVVSWAKEGKAAPLGVRAEPLRFPNASERSEVAADDLRAVAPAAVLALSAAEDARRRRIRNWWVLGTVAAVLVLVVAVVARVRAVSGGATAQPITARLGGDFIEAKDGGERVIWTHRFAEPVAIPAAAGFPDGRDLMRIADFYGDGQREVAAIVSLQKSPNRDETAASEVDFFSAGGQLRWRYVPDRTFQFGTHALKSPWAVHDLLVSNADGKSTLWVASNHHTWGNSFVVQLDPRTGEEKLRFVNTGIVYVLHEVRTAEKTYLLVGGFNNEWGGSLAIFDEKRAFGASPQTTGSRHECLSCPAGVPDYYFVFPRTEINTLVGLNEDSVTDIQVTDDGIEVDKKERPNQGIEATIYLLSAQPPFRLISLRYNSDYDIRHRQWSAEGKLGHTLEDCPERKHPAPVRVWTPENGWTEVAVPAAAANQ
jgi:hypothetical protein